MLNHPQIFMQGGLQQFDPDARVLSKPILLVVMHTPKLCRLAVTWSLVTLASDNKTLVAVGATNETAYPFNIYRDVKAVPEDRQSPFANNTYNLSTSYRIDNITVAPIAVLGQHDWDGVDTDIEFTQAVPVSYYDPRKQPCHC
jgi:hypothetical protein